MIISKSDYTKYLQCPKLLWLYKNRKDLIPEILGEQMQLRMDTGNEVEKYAYKLFPWGIKVDGYNFQKNIELSSQYIMGGETVLFQPSFLQDDLFCRCDVIEKKDGVWDIYEVKSATKVKDEYIPDLAWQKYCLERSGLKTGRTFVIYINNEYVRQGGIKPEEFLVTEEVSELVDTWYPRVKEDIAKMKYLVGEREEHQERDRGK